MIKQQLEFHPVADIFPMMNAGEYSGLISDIQENGLREAIWLHSDGRIIDGRNRYKACLEGGIEPDFRTYDGSESMLVPFVVSLNLHRRHLDSGQLAFVALAIESYEGKRAKERQGRRTDLETDDANSLFDEWPGDETDQELLEDLESLDSHKNIEARKPQSSRAPQSRKVAADAVGVGERYVQDAKAIRAKAPELEKEVMNGSLSLPQAKKAARLDEETRKTVVEKVKTGEAKNVKQAINQVKEAKREERRAANKEKIQDTEQVRVEVMDAKFATIVADPPWSPESVGVVDVVGRSNPTYATMGAEEIANLKCWDKPVSALSDVDAHLYLWVVNRSIDHGLKIMEKWGFRFVTVITWCKPSIGLGNYFRNNTEHVLFGVKGSQPLKRHDIGTWFEAKRGPKGHSSKPEEFYKIVESCSPGPYLEIFSRREADEWTCWGESE